nr:flagellar hook assembly protein FlgD [Pseudomonas jilinensis]
MMYTNNVGAGALDNYQIDNERFNKGGELGKDEFLKLLVVQLNNQDPLSPQENGEFIAQLAQFSTVEGIGNLNDSMEAIMSGFQSSQALQASSLVGRTVIVPTDKAIVDTAEGIKGDVVLPQSSSNVFVGIYDEAGTLVQRINLGSQQSGLVAFEWDGTDSDGNVLPPGKYSFKAEAGIEGENQQLITLLPANVDSVSLPGTPGGDLILNVAGLGSIGLSQVQIIGK